MAKQTEKSESQVNNDCFVIMPIADPEGYESGHFAKVYEDIFKPACQSAGFNPIRADQIQQTNLIHLDILSRLIDSPMAICDLSSRNPNVLFELGLRQAFDKPTVLVQEVGTPQIFDIAPLRYTRYRRELKYREVLEDQQFIAEAISATKNACDRGEGVNSIVKILSLAKPAALKDVSSDDLPAVLQLVRAELSDMKSYIRQSVNNSSRYTESFSGPELSRDVKRHLIEKILLETKAKSLSSGDLRLNPQVIKKVNMQLDEAKIDLSQKRFSDLRDKIRYINNLMSPYFNMTERYSDSDQKIIGNIAAIIDDITLQMEVS
jgi:hypothetical protein